VEKYIEKRKSADKSFTKDFDAGYEEFKIGVMLREAREQQACRKKSWRGSPEPRSRRFRGWRTMPRT